MIKSFRHRGLTVLYEGRREGKVLPSHVAELEHKIKVARIKAA